MQLVCQICHQSFTWTRPSGRHRSHSPKICGSPGKDGKWIPNSACNKLRQAKQSARWAKNHPKKVKANYFKQYKKRKEAKKLIKAEHKNVPKQPKNRCVNILTDDKGVKYQCNKITARGGSNLRFCQSCWNRLSNGVSQEYSLFIYDQSCSQDIETKNPHQV